VATALQDRRARKQRRQAAAHDLGAAAQATGIDAHSNAEHQLVALVLGFNDFRRELRLRGYEGDLRRDGDVGIGVEHDACIGAEPHLAGLLSR
jgi:hypothetical protein